MFAISSDIRNRDPNYLTAFFSPEKTRERMVDAVASYTFSRIELEFSKNWIFKSLDGKRAQDCAHVFKCMIRKALAPRSVTPMFLFLINSIPFSRLMGEPSLTNTFSNLLFQKAAVKLVPLLILDCWEQNHLEAFSILCEKIHKVATHILSHAAAGDEKKALSDIMDALLGTPFYSVFRDKVMIPWEQEQSSAGFVAWYDAMHKAVEEEWSKHPSIHQLENAKKRQLLKYEAIDRFVEQQKQVPQQKDPIEELADRLVSHLQLAAIARPIQQCFSAAQKPAS